MSYLHRFWLFFTLWVTIFIAGFFLIVQEIIRFFNPTKTRYIAYVFLRFFIRCFMKVNMMKVEVVGRENIPSDGKYVFMSNHQDQCDILLIYGYLNQPMAMVAKKELRFIPVIGHWMVQMDCYLIDRKDPRQALRLFTQAAKNINDGYPALIYPEGTRSLGPKNGPFLQGTMRLPLLANVPIVPITLSGSWKPLHGKKHGAIASKMMVVVGKPIDTTGYGKHNVKELASMVQTAVEQNYTADNNESLKAQPYKAKY